MKCRVSVQKCKQGRGKRARRRCETRNFMADQGKINLHRIARANRKGGQEVNVAVSCGGRTASVWHNKVRGSWDEGAVHKLDPAVASKIFNQPKSHFKGLSGAGNRCRTKDGRFKRCAPKRKRKKR